MKRLVLLWGIVFLVGLVCASGVQAGKPGRTNLFIRLAGSTGFSQAPVDVEVGDELNIEMFLEGRGESITGVDIFLEFDDSYLQLIPARTTPDIRPFTQGPYLRGTVAKNSTLGDAVGGGGNQFAFFQLQYNEDIAPSGFTGEQRAAVGDGVCATFKLRVIRKPSTVTSGIRVVRNSPTGSETGYFKKGDAGAVYNFNQITELTLSIRGLELDVDLPDLYLRPGQVDSTLDLDAFVDDDANPDSTLVWTNSVPVPDSIQVGINPTSHRVLVDTRIIEGVDTTNFIGISQVTFTATTAFNETVSDQIRIIVDTPPALLDSVIRDSVIFYEDRDTTFTLVAIDPDPGARLTFSTLSRPDDITPTITTQTVNGDTVFQTVTFTATNNFSGSGKVRFAVTDQFALADTIEVDAVVRPVNDPPQYLKAFPEIIIDAVGQHMLNLAEYVRDIDDPLPQLQFAFTGVDSVAFDVTANNERLIITPVRPFQGTRTATVVVTDTSNAVATQRITVRVNPPLDPQRPEITSSGLRVNVQAGGGPTTTNLDTIVQDIDTPDNLLTWTHSPISLVNVNATALSNRQFQVTAASDSIGYRTMTLRVNDPDQLADTLQVRVFSASIDTGIPVIGGLPSGITLVTGEQDTLNLDEYYYDADHSNGEVTWTAEHSNNLIVTIDPNSHMAIFQAADGASNIVEDVVLTVTDPEGKSASDTLQVTILDPGSVSIDFGILGGQLEIGVGADSLSLRQFVRIGNPDSLSWNATSRNTGVVFAQALGDQLLLIGLGVGNTRLILTATHQGSGRSARDSINVSVVIPATPDTLAVEDIGELNITAGRDTTIDLRSRIVAGNAANVAWSVGTNLNVAVEIDTLNQKAILRAPLDFSGNAGELVFLAHDVASGLTATSVASPVFVARGAIGSDLFKIEVIINPILKNFLDVFVRSRRALQGPPTLNVRVGEDPNTPRNNIPITPVELVANMWVGDLRLSNETTGIVELTTTGITQETRVGLLDTLRLNIERASVRSTFNMSLGEVAVTLPAGGVDAPSAVALIPDRRDDALAKPVANNLEPVTDTYMIYAPQARVARSGEIAFALSYIPENAGVYREDATTGKWHRVGGEVKDGLLLAEFDAFGRYGVFVDLNPVSDFKLYQNFPNPFNPQTSIRFDLSEADQVQLVIYNALGQEVRQLITGFLPSGRHVISWDARDNFGRGVSAGVYVYQMRTSKSAITRKMILLK